MKRVLIGVVVGLLVGATGVGAQERESKHIEKVAQGRTWAATLAETVKPGETVTWRSHRIGTVTDYIARVNGVEMAYETPAKANNCVAFAYRRGIAIRLTDCAKSKRTGYVTVRAVNVSAKSARLTVRFTNR